MTQQISVALQRRMLPQCGQYQPIHSPLRVHVIYTFYYYLYISVRYLDYVYVNYYFYYYYYYYYYYYHLLYQLHFLCNCNYTCIQRHRA